MNSEHVEKMCEAASEQIIEDIMRACDDVANLYDVVDGLVVMQVTGIRVLRNVLTNSIGLLRPEATEEELREFHDEWVKDTVEAMSVGKGTSLLELREQISAQQNRG